MKRIVEQIQRITYSISERQVRSLIREHAHELGQGTDHQGPVFAEQTTIERQDDGGYDIVTEYLTKEEPKKEEPKKEEPKKEEPKKEEPKKEEPKK